MNRETALPKSPRLLHDFFDSAARRWPGHMALDVPPGPLRPERRQATYGELKERSDALACLLDRAASRDAVVAILLPRNSECLAVAQLAVLKSGAAYTCIDPGFPDAQAADILRDCNAAALLTDGTGKGRAQRFGIPGLQVLEADTPPCLTGEVHEPRGARSSPVPESLAYVIYTSGTTGRPKGVMIEHRSIVNLVQSDLDEFGLGPGDRVVQGSSSAYDSSVEETWLALASGATLVVMDDETARLGPDLPEWLRREGITVFCPPPTLLRATSCEDPRSALPGLRLLYVGGEALPGDLADRWARGRRLVNGYGPTECTVTCLRGDILPGQAVHIGKPVPAVKAWVVNERIEEVADGEPGELCIGGACLARGYRGQPGLTQDRFPEHPSLGRIYRTGDLVHREADGTFVCHGRIDSQVKLRGYRIELEAVEARLSALPGVRQAACSVQGEGARKNLVAFIVPERAADAHSQEDLRSALSEVLPGYMVPSRVGILEALPTTTGGKLDRKRLPLLEAPEPQAPEGRCPPRNAIEEKIASAFNETLGLTGEISVLDDFFRDLGGDSLSAAILVSLLRDHPATAGITVRDLYEAPTAAALALRARPAIPDADQVRHGARGAPATFAKRLLTTLAQGAVLLLALLVAAQASYVLVCRVLPWVAAKVGLVSLILLAPVLSLGGLMAYVPLSVGLVVLLKKLLIGRYRPIREPVWGWFYLRHWTVQQAASLVPWPLMAGTEQQNVVLRLLGARIGRRVSIHRGAHLWQGGWDLLNIGDDVSIGRDASLRLVDLEEGQVVVGPVSLGDGATLETRATVGPGARLEPEAYLTALSSLPADGCIPRGERWDGIPARPAGLAPPAPVQPPGEKTLSPLAHGALMGLTRIGLWWLVTLPFGLVALGLALVAGLGASAEEGWTLGAAPGLSIVIWASGLAVLSVPLSLALEAFAMRALGRVAPGVVGRWGAAYLRVWLKTALLESAGLWLSGTLMWPYWLRAVGMEVGPGCEISTLLDVVPELLHIGPESFFADGVYLGPPIVHRGSAVLEDVWMGKNTFFGNHAVVPAGERLPEDILIGICTVAKGSAILSGTSWFGHPAFELPRREVVACDRRLTHEPSLIRIFNRLLWECARFTLPLFPAVVLAGWFAGVAAARAALTPRTFMALAVPLLALAVPSALCLLVLVLKWALLGRVRPGTHPLWSCWCSRWDFLYVAWAFCARKPLLALEGTLLLSWYLRAMGMRIGKGVVLSPGFAQVVDPDMLHLDDGATVGAIFQAHTFEDRVLKIDHIRVGPSATLGSGSVPLYGADVGESTRVSAHSVIMKRERLLPGFLYEGVPTRTPGAESAEEP